MKKVALLLFSAIIMAACSFFDVDVTDFVSPESSYENDEQVYMALVGVYAPLGDLSFYGRDWFHAFNLQDDLSFYDRNYVRQELFLNNFTYENATLNNLWANLYSGVDRANSFLEHIVSAEIDEETARTYIGEVRFLRAYYYFILSSLWGDVPLKVSSTRSVDYSKLSMAASPASDVFDFIIKEMEYSVNLVKPADELNGPGRISRTTVAGILSRVYLKTAGFPLNRGKQAYEMASFWGRKVMDSNLHQLNPDYVQLFKNLSEDKYDLTYRENLWEIEFKGNNQDGHKTGGFVGSYNGVYNNQTDSYGFGYGFVSCTLKLWDLYDDSSDVRKDWNICQYYYRNGVKTYRNLAGNQYVYCNAGKFRREYEVTGSKDKDYTPLNFPVLRYADVLLMVAEAENEAYDGPTELAYRCLNAVRHRASQSYPDVTGLDKAQFRQLVRDERGRELCFECLRKQDLIRWGIYVEEMTTGRTAQVADSRWHVNKAYAGYIANYTEFRHNWYPVPSKELATNKKMRQNEYW